MFLEWCWDKKTSETRFCSRNCSHTLSHGLQRPDWVQYCCWHKDFIAELLSLIPKLKSGNMITTGHYIDYQTFSPLQGKPLLKNCFHSFHKDLKDTSVEKMLVLRWCLEKSPFLISNLKGFQRWPLLHKLRFHSIEIMVHNLEGVSVLLHKIFGGTEIPF